MAGELRATVLTTVKGEAVKKLQKDLGGLSDSLKGLGGVVGKVAKGFAGFATAIGATKFISGSIEQAKLLEQSYRSLETVFGPLSGEMQKFAEGAAKIGLSQTEAAKASIFIGNVLQQYGISAQDAADKTQTLVGLAADLAFVTGYDVQEALLGMTALFRGEYDPIEKFGVAMKQNEIESIKAARGLEKLTGQAELHADVLIREELLLQRTGKSLGAFTDNSDTLAVQTEVLRATFENLQATLGQELSPVIAQFYSDLIPIIEEAGPGLVKVFEAIAEVIKGLAGIFIDLFDPTTNLGDSVVELGVQFESLYQTIFGKDFDIAHIFEAANHILSFVIDSIKNLIKFFETLIIYVKAWAEYMQAIFEGDWEKVADGVDAIANKMIAVRDATNQSKVAFQLLLAEIKKNPTDLGDTREIWDVAGSSAKESGKKSGDDYLDGVDESLNGDKPKNAIKDFWSGLSDEVAKQSAKMKLTSMGASEGLIGAILGTGEDWKKVFDSIVKGGAAGLKKAQAMFNKTAAGIKEIEDAAEKAAEALEKQAKAALDAEIKMRRQLADSGSIHAEYHNAYADALSDGADAQTAIEQATLAYATAIAERNKELIQQQKELKEAFRETAKEIFESFRGVGKNDNLGQYASAVITLREELSALVEENDKLFSRRGGGGDDRPSGNAQENLVKSIKNVTDSMLIVAQARDELEEKIGKAKSLFASVRDAIFGGFNITDIRGKSENIIKSFKKTVEQTKAFALQITQLREAGLTGDALQQIIASGVEAGGATAKALLAGGPAAISEINALYTELGLVADTIGDQAATAMFGAGVDVSNGLINGLMAQQSELEMAAEALADAFQKAFKRASDRAMISINAPTSVAAIVDMINQGGIIEGQQVAGTRPNYSGGTGGNFSININAGLGTDPVALGREVVSAIQRYEATNGRVWARA